MAYTFRVGLYLLFAAAATAATTTTTTTITELINGANARRHHKLADRSTEPRYHPVSAGARRPAAIAV